MRTYKVGSINWNADFVLDFGSQGAFTTYAHGLWAARFTTDHLNAVYTAVAANFALPSLSAAGGATVDASFNITFTDNPTWRAAVTSVKIGSSTLHPTAWRIEAGILTLVPANDALLQTSGSKSVHVLATGYANNDVTQAIAVGAADHLTIHTQPTAPASNGAALAVQPVIYIVDKYGNRTADTTNVVAAKGAGTWTIGGTVTKAAVSGAATYTNVTATSSGAVSGATITFTCGALPVATSAPFNIPAP